MPKATRTEIQESDSAGVLTDLREIQFDLSHSRGLISTLIFRDSRVRCVQAVIRSSRAMPLPLLMVGAGVGLRVVMPRMSAQQLTAVEFGSAIRQLPPPPRAFEHELQMTTEPAIHPLDVDDRARATRERILERPRMTNAGVDGDVCLGMTNHAARLAARERDMALVS